jgi:hypothetical protein
MPRAGIRVKRTLVTVGVTHLLCSESICTLIHHQLTDQVALFALNTRQNLFPRLAGILGEAHLAPVWE